MSKLNCGSYTTLVGDKSFVAWINPRSYGKNSEGRVIDNGKTYIRMSSTFRASLTSDASILASSATNSILHTNKWYLLIFTRTSTGITNAYVNGVLSGTANQSSGTPTAGTTNLIIGNNDAASYTFDGQISNVRIYDGILSTQEITQLYQNEKGLYNL